MLSLCYHLILILLQTRNLTQRNSTSIKDEKKQMMWFSLHLLPKVLDSSALSALSACRLILDVGEKLDAFCPLPEDLKVKKRPRFETT